MSLAAINKAKSAMRDADDDDVPTPDLRGLIRRSMLLNVGVALAALPFAALPRSQAAAVLLLAGIITVAVWIVTLLASVCLLTVSQARRLSRLLVVRQTPRSWQSSASSGVADD